MLVFFNGRIAHTSVLQSVNENPCGRALVFLCSCPLIPLTRAGVAWSSGAALPAGLNCHWRPLTKVMRWVLSNNRNRQMLQFSSTSLGHPKTRVSLWPFLFEEWFLGIHMYSKTALILLLALRMDPDQSENVEYVALPLFGLLLLQWSIVWCCTYSVSSASIMLYNICYVLQSPV